MDEFVSFPRTSSFKISASSDAEENPAVRQALFDEFQQIEWQARVEAIRERLDEQRSSDRSRREQEQADREAAGAGEQRPTDRQCRSSRREREWLEFTVAWGQVAPWGALRVASA